MRKRGKDKLAHQGNGVKRKSRCLGVYQDYKARQLDLDSMQGRSPLQSKNTSVRVNLPEDTKLYPREQTEKKYEKKKP
jgi:hypothetical protein